MALKVYKPTSPGRRGMTGSTFEEITKKRPEKSLVVPLKRKAGRNNQGKVTVRHRGGGAKRMLRIIDFKRNKMGVVAKVLAIEYDPNRSAFIALVVYGDGEKRYILAPLELKVGDIVKSGEDAEVKGRSGVRLLSRSAAGNLRLRFRRPGGDLGRDEHDRRKLRLRAHTPGGVSSVAHCRLRPGSPCPLVLHRETGSQTHPLSTILRHGIW